jgi:preprotein translocase subunit SecG
MLAIFQFVLILSNLYVKIVLFMCKGKISTYLWTGGGNMQVLFTIIILVSSLFLIVTILLQPGKSEGLGTIGGGAESIWGKNKGRSYEGILSKLTTVSAILFIISALILAAIQ